MGRRLHVEIFRYNPCDPNSKPKMQSFYVEEKNNMNLFILLNEIREEQDPSLKFDFVCRAGVCGSCGILINGKPMLACKTKTKDLPDHILLHPLPGFKIIGDLSVDTGIWFREMEAYIRSWIHTSRRFDPKEEEFRMDNELAEEIFLIDRCIECGCCIAACGTLRFKEGFLSAPAINRIARFMIDPRDERGEQDFFEVIGTEKGVFGCVGLMACEDVCPKGIKLQETISFVRKKVAKSQIKDNIFLRILSKFFK